ncbi:OsmC family protein [Caldalkalibacillus salinus]|uniref:OsmC family protein n=1 Tax=Caldalkalibacillus salinus TaxID=2803787 RepID=UPI0019222BDD|nr:OsmC family protein [Caldalkalibacillus salinus]
MHFKMKEPNGFTTQLEYGELHISGDETYGYRPYQLMVSSIAVCSGGVLRKVLEKKRYTVDDISVEAEVTRNEQGAQEIQKIHLHFRVACAGLSEQQLEKALNVTRKNCSMVQSVKDSIEITERFELVSN